MFLKMNGYSEVDCSVRLLGFNLACEYENLNDRRIPQQ